MLNWLFGERGQREKCFAHSRERLHRGGNYVWSLTPQGHYFLFGSRPGGAEVPEYRFQTLQLAVIQRQKESNRQVADLIITTRVAHDLIATGGLGYGELHRSEVRQTDNGWQIVIGFRKVTPDLKDLIPQGAGNAVRCTEGDPDLGLTYILKGPGAGLDATINAMLCDMTELVRRNRRGQVMTQ